MKKTMKILALVLAIATLAMTFVACGSTTEEVEAEKKHEADVKETLEKLQNKYSRIFVLCRYFIQYRFR